MRALASFASFAFVAFAVLAVAGCADILGMDKLGPAVRDGEDEQEHLPDAAARADASDQ